MTTHKQMGENVSSWLPFVVVFLFFYAAESPDGPCPQFYVWWQAQETGLSSVGCTPLAELTLAKLSLLPVWIAICYFAWFLIKVFADLVGGFLEWSLDSLFGKDENSKEKTDRHDYDYTDYP